jgi:hypothetical protein
LDRSAKSEAKILGFSVFPRAPNREFVIEWPSVDNDAANGRGTIALFGTLGTVGDLNDPGDSAE